ncbi:hypothetical protein [Sphaerisporangium dianthi]|uniref:Uncharacterized protein n=1 Tax=Sphaerisporangium dianthi TaxID=1436120 RepID=A0ABV9CPL5_9ACTN
MGEPAGGVHEAAAVQPVDDSGQLCLGEEDGVVTVSANPLAPAR